MTIDPKKVKTIFDAVMALPPADREPYLDKECGEDDALRVEVESLLEHHFTQAKTVEDNLEFESIQLDHQLGDTIGKFKIISVLGEGGMGIVYLAEQSKPVKRRVALKVIKAGMDTKQVIARFEAERQALAIMNHPGIAQVYEAGATEEGRPYFVLEYVKGLPITEACDEHKLNTIQRLELLSKVCDAVQHAHMKGIIHRDLKPTNILVSAGDDDVLEPKIIDFGVAKATSQSLTDLTLVTQVGRFIGTPAYMSPEQADLKASDIDTRSDVYALGVIMYEVLTGRPPFDPKVLQEAGLEKMREIIREQDPPRPSTQLSTLDGLDATKIAKARQTQINALAGLLRKELEWIPLKALRKLPSERYDSAKSMGDDIQRYLRGDPLEAGPETALYRFKKVIRRYKGPFIAATIVFTVLLGGIIGTSWQWMRAEQSTKALEEGASALRALNTTLSVAQQKVTETLQLAITEMDRVETVLSVLREMLQWDPAQAEAMDKGLVTAMLEKASMFADVSFEDKPLGEADIRDIIGNAYVSLGLYDKADPQLSSALGIRRRLRSPHNPDLLGSIYSMGVLHKYRGLYDSAESLYREALIGQTQSLGREHPATLDTLLSLSNLLIYDGRYSEGETISKEALEISRRLNGNENDTTIVAINNLGDVFYYLARYDEAETLYREALQTSTSMYLEDGPRVLRPITNMAKILQVRGKYDEAGKYLRRALEGNRSIYGDAHPHTIITIINLGKHLVRIGRYDGGERLYNEALQTSIMVLGDEHPTTINTKLRVAELMVARGHYKESESLFLESIESAQVQLSTSHPIYLSGNLMYAQLLSDLERKFEAEIICREVLKIASDTYGEESKFTMEPKVALGRLLAEGKVRSYEEADTLLQHSIDQSSEMMGESHPLTLEAIANIAFLRTQQARYIEGEEIYRQVLASRRDIFGDEHPETLELICEFSDSLVMQSKFEEAVESVSEALNTSQRALGDEHIQTLDVTEKLLNIYFRQGDFTSVDQLAQELLEVRRKVEGNDHIDTLMTMRLYMSSLINQHKLKEAGPYMLEALEITRNIFGDDHVQTSSALQALSAVFEAQEKWEEAEKYAVEVLELQRRTLGETHPSVFYCIEHLGELFLKQNKFEEAHLRYLEGFALVGGNDPQIPVNFDKRLAINHLVDLYEAWEKPVEAQKYRAMLFVEEDSQGSKE